MNEKLFEELNKVFEKYDTNLADFYWTIVIEGYLGARMFNENDEKCLPLKVEETEDVVGHLLNDDQLWADIDGAVEYWLYHLIFNKKGK